MSTNIKDKSVVENENGEETLIAKRLRRQAKNKLKKVENKRLREEELRRKLCEPKDQRVRIVNQKELDKILKQKEHITSNHIPNITSEEFPSLNLVRSKTRDKHRNLSGQTTTSECVSPERGSINPDWHINHKATDSLQTEKTPPEQILQLQKNQKLNSLTVKPKRNDPICIDVMTALKRRELSSSSDNRPPVSKKELPQRLGGNQLDSSNPERKRGKMREVPKVKKPTILKRIILQEREIRKLDRANLASLGEMQMQTVKMGLVESSLTNRESTGSNPKLSPDANIDLSNDLNESQLQDVTETTTTVSELTTQDAVEDTTLHHEILGSTHQAQDAETVAISRIKNIAKMELHSRRFREYCDHVLSPELDVAVSALVTDIVKFQDRAYFNDPVKAHAKRRFVIGFREVKKYLHLNKLKLIIIAPDLEKIKAQGGLDDLIEHIKVDATSRQVPYVFAVGRKGLKILTNKPRQIPGISCIGVLNWEGTQDNFKSIQDLLPALREQYASMIEVIDKRFQLECKIGPDAALTENEEIKVELPVDVNTVVVAAFLSKLTKELRNN